MISCSIFCILLESTCAIFWSFLFLLASFQLASIASKISSVVFCFFLNSWMYPCILNKLSSIHRASAWRYRSMPGVFALCWMQRSGIIFSFLPHIPCSSSPKWTRKMIINLKSATYRVSWDFACKTTKIHLRTSRNRS